MDKSRRSAPAFIDSLWASAFRNNERLKRVESAPSKFSEADIQTGSTDSLFRKSPWSGKAEKQAFIAIFLIDSYWREAETQIIN